VQGLDTRDLYRGGQTNRKIRGEDRVINHPCCGELRAGLGQKLAAMHQDQDALAAIDGAPDQLGGDYRLAGACRRDNQHAAAARSDLQFKAPERLALVSAQCRTI
jgi:hypothetical protein